MTFYSFRIIIFLIDIMKHRHDKIKKEDRPVEGEIYDVFNGDDAVFRAEIKEYTGTCWAKVSVVAPLSEKVTGIYHKGDEFDIKVASYTYSKAEL